MKIHSLTPILNVSDVAASLEWFEAIGWERSFVWTDEGGMGGAGEPDFASVCSGDAQIFLCRNELGARPVWMSWFLSSLDELEAAHARAVELGCEIAMEPTDEPWGMREFHLRHPDGHTFRVGTESG